MSNSFNLDKDEMQPTSKNISKQSSNSMYLASPKRRRFAYFQRISSLSEIERLYQNISIISTKYLQDYHNQSKVLEFESKYKTKLKGGYIDIVLIIKEFNEFNIFDYISIFSKIKSKMEMKKMKQARNNILLSILTEAKEAQLLEKSESNNTLNEKYFNDLSFLNPIVDELSTLVIESETFNPYDFEIEVFFLSILEYKDKGRMIKQKHNAYFKDFTRSLNLPEKFSFDDLILDTISKNSYAQYTDCEIIILRKIIANSAKRKFYSGFKFLLKLNPYNILMSEGRIWKNIGQNLLNEQVYILWTLYEEDIEQVRNTDQKPTLAIEYKSKLIRLSQTILHLSKKKENELKKKTKLEFDRSELEKEISLYYVTCLKELLVIFFQYDLKELIMFFFDQYKNVRNFKKIPIDIYNLCLDYDEDISIDITDRALTQATAKDIYMKIVLLKKFLRLAKCLLKFTVCKNYLNSPPPLNENYIWLMHKQQVKRKNEEFQKTVYNNESKNDGDKLITFLHEEQFNSSIQSYYQNNSGSFQELLNEGNNNPIEANNNPNVLKLKENETKDNSPTNPVIYSEIKNENNNNVLKTGLLKSIELLNEQKKKPYSSANYDNGYSVRLKDSNTLKEDSDLSAVAPVKKSSNKSILIKEKTKLDKDKSKTALQFRKSEFRPNIIQIMDSKDPSSQQSVYKTQINTTKTLDEIKLNQMKQKNPEINVQSILIEELRYGQYVFDALCLLLSINDPYINLDYAEKTCKNLLVFTTNEEAIAKCSYPLISIALAAEYLNKIGRLCQKIQYKTLSVVEELLKLGESIQSSMKDEDMLNYFLKEQTDHIGRNALEIYAENNFYRLLNDICVGDIVGKMWYGAGYELSIFRFFRLTRILSSNIVYENYVTLVKRNYLPKDSIYTFQFNHYIKNCSVRFSVSGLMIVISTLLYQAVIFFYVEGTRTEGDPFKSIPFYLFSLSVNTKAILNLLNALLCFIYYYKTGRRPRISLFELGTDLVLLVSIVINIFNFPEKICPYDKNQECNLLLNGIIYSSIILTSWMRVIAVLLKTLAYGSFFRIMFQIVWHVFVFLLITFCLDFCFAQVLTIFFKNSNDDFYEIFYGFITLFNTAFGQVNFENFTQLTIYGYVCLISYTTVSNIMLFNLIVGIIDNLFDELEDKADAENRSLLILAYERIKWDDRYGLLILLPSPFNAFSIIFIIILLIAGKIDEDYVKKLNMTFSKICYFFIALAYFFILVILGFLCIPFAYIKSIIHSCYDSIITQDPKKIALSFFIFFIFRLWDLIKFFMEDLYLFWTLVYKEPPNHEDVLNKHVITKDHVLALRNVLTKLKFKEKKKIITLEELYLKIGITKKRRRTCLFGDSNHSVLYSPSNVNSHKNTTESFISGNTYMDQESVKEVMKELIDRIVDVDGIIDIERTLYVLPYRVKYNEAYLNNLSHVNIRVLLRGLRKYFFANDVSNSIYSYKRMQQIVFKLLIKFNLIYNFIPRDVFENIKLNFNAINNDYKFQKTTQALVKYEQKEDISEYDDAGDLGYNPSEIGGNITE